jgi:hypothetical protein
MIYTGTNLLFNRLKAPQSKPHAATTLISRTGQAVKTEIRIYY